MVKKKNISQEKEFKKKKVLKNLKNKLHYRKYWRNI